MKKQLIDEAKRLQELAGIDEIIKIEKPVGIKNYKQFVGKFNQVFLNILEPLDIEEIRSEQADREEGETYMLSLDKIDQDITYEQVEEIFNDAFSKYGISTEIEDNDDYISFYLDPIEF